jgi:hypothetical protein
MPRPESKAVRYFLTWFVPLYALLIVPWPGSRNFYGNYLCSVAKTVLATNGGRQLLRFEQVPEARRNRTLDTRITVANREQLDASGSGRAVMLDFDSRGVGWMPTALLIALVVSTPISWPRRAWALLWGLLAIHAFVLFSLQVYIWNESDTSSGLSLIAFSPFWKFVVNGLEETLITQLGASFAAPTLVWIFSTFRTDDLRAFAALARRPAGSH